MNKKNFRLMSIFMTFVLMLGNFYSVGAAYNEKLSRSRVVAALPAFPGMKGSGANVLDGQDGTAYEITIANNSSSVSQASHAEKSILANALTRPMKYYGVDRASPYTDANYATLAQHAVKTIIVDTFINDANNSSNAKWSHIKALAAQYGFNYVIWPNQGGDVPGCGWETPFNSPQNGDYIWRVTTMLDSFMTDPHFIGMISAHEPMWNTSTCKTSISDMASIKTQLKNYMQTKGRTDFKVWNYIDNVSDLKNMSGFVSADIERVMDVAVTWQHCFGGAEGTCTGAKNKIIADRALIDNAGLNGKVDLVYLFQTFATGGGYSMPTLTDMQTWDCQFIATNALDGFMYYTWGAWYSTDLRNHPELWPEMNRVYDSCINQAPDTSAPTVLSSVRANVDPTSAASVNFTVTFSEGVTSVAADDFSLTTSGVLGAAVSGVSGSGSVYTVSVNTGLGNGTIRLDVVDNNSIMDSASNPLGGTAVGDGNFTSGQTYTIAKPFSATSMWTNAFDQSHGWTVAQYVRTVGDVNNDGRDDLVGFGLDGVYVSLSTGSGFGAVSKWSSSFDQSHGWTVAQYVRTVGDVNNDGRDDLVGFGLDGVYVSLSTGSGFGAVSKWSSSFVPSHVRTVGDVNNDGNADLIGFGLDGVYVALSNGSGFGAVSKWISSFVPSHVRTVGDVNNDGRDDLVGFGLDGVYVALSTGSGFGVVSKWSSSFDLSHGWTVADFVRTVGDVNNDGRDDLIGFGQDGVYVALSTGSGFGAVSRWTNDFDLSHGWTVSQYVRTVGDVNNDGKADLVGFGLDGVYIATAK